MICDNCGAAFDGDRQFCEHCGARVAQGVANLEAYRTSPERFDRVEVAPGYQTTLQYAPPLSALRELRRPVVRLVLACAVAVLVIANAISDGELKILLTLGGFGCGWVVFEAYRLVLVIRRVAARTKRAIVIITADRFSPGDPAGTCDHRVMVRSREGGLRRVWAPGYVIGQVTVGDIGVAYVRHDRLLDFRWFDVMAPPLEAGEMPRPASCRACGGPQRFGPISDRCAYCGEPLPKPDLGEFGSRFMTAAASAAAAAAARKRIPFGVPSLLPPLGLVAMGSFYAYVGYLARELLIAATERWRLGFIIPLLVMAPLAVGIVWLWQRTAPYRAGLRHELAVVIRTRAELVREENDTQTWRYFATIASPNGARRELRVLEKLSNRLARGHLGVAHVRGVWLADFTEVGT